MGKSFRLRLAVSAALLAGVALAGFAAIAWWHMHGAKIDTLDREIRDQAERELSRPWPAEHWTHHQHNMGKVFGAFTAQQSLLLMQDRDGIVYRSEHWPEALDAANLPWPGQKQLASAATDNAGRYPDAAWPPNGIGPFDVDFPPPPYEGYPPPIPGRRPPPPDGLVGGFPPAGPPRAQIPAFTMASFNAGNQYWRFGLAALPGGEKLAIGVDLAVIETEMAELRNAFLLAFPLALSFIGLGAWFLSGRALSPIRQLTATMGGITAKGLDQRIELGKEDMEFRQLADVFNGMLERLESSFLQASRFSADAAHELKTPLAILQGQIERAMSQCEDGSPVQTSLADILDEVQRLGTISRKLLLLSLADAGRLRLFKTPFNLSQALADLLEDAQMLTLGLDVSGTIAPGLIIEADAELLRQVLHNLLSNAIKYNLPKGWIRITASRQNGRVEISFINASTGIPTASQKRIFERFFRADPAHNRQIEGVGLGLSLSREIVRAHGGDLLLIKSDQTDTRFLVFF